MMMDMFKELHTQAQHILARYEEKQAAMLPVLYLIQERFGAITADAEDWVAQLLEVAPSHVHEVVTFYTLFHQRAVGTYHVQVCQNISCAPAASSSASA